MKLTTMVCHPQWLPRSERKKNENCDAHLFISVNPRARETTPVIRTLKGNGKQFELSG